MKFSPFVVVLFLLAACEPAAAQTAHIAHFSHGGSLATLVDDVALDNFGIPHFESVYSRSKSYEPDSIVRISDTTAVGYGDSGKGQAGGKSSKVIQYDSRTEPALHGKSVKLLRQVYPKAKFIGFDTLRKPAALPAPVLKKRRAKSKEDELGLLGLPRHPGVWGLVAVVVCLAGLGWLLGKEHPQLEKA